MKTRVLSAVLLLSLLPLPALAQTERTVSLRHGPKFAVTVPMGYSFETKNNDDGSIAIRMENPVWNIRIDALVARESDPRVTDREWQQSKLMTFVAEALSIAEESDYRFHPLPALSGTGIYCVFTAHGAPDPPPGENVPGSRYTGGLKAWPGCVVIFRIISGDASSPEYQEAVQVFTHSFTKL